MDLVEEWAIKIAEAVAPDEIDLAPLTAQAFLSGGKNKEALFQRPKGGVPGAFDPTSAAVPVLPWIFDAIAHAAPVLHHILGASGDGRNIAKRP